MKSLAEMMAESAENRMSSLTAEQRKIIGELIEVAESYARNEITLEEAEYNTIGPVFRLNVTRTLSPKSRHWKPWMKLINDVCMMDTNGYWTNHGYFTKSELDLGSGRVRVRTKTDHMNKTETEIIEFMYPDSSGQWHWPTEKPIDFHGPKPAKSKEDAFTKKQWDAWSFPETE